MIASLRSGYRLLYPHRRAVLPVAYASISAVAYVLAYLLRLEFVIPREQVEVILATLPFLFMVRLACSAYYRLSVGRWRFVGTSDVLRLVASVITGTAVFALLVYGLHEVPRVPVSVVLLEAVLTIFLTAATWIGYRSGFTYLRRRFSPEFQRAKRVVVVGAGEAGAALVHEMLQRPTGYVPMGMVDDDPLKWGSHLHGVEIVGSTVDLAPIALQLGAQKIVVAVPSATPAEFRRLMEKCEHTGLPVRVLPGIREVLGGKVRIEQLRDVRLEDLLGRDPIRLELPELALDLHDRSVLITGAAGSIGSELARQVALHAPGTLVLFDHAETSLYYLELELRERHPQLRLVPVVGDIVDAGAVERVFRDYAPDRVFHAAAYKHVPMMELNTREAIRNNVIGTWRVADAAGRHRAEKFVLVSTDKAVRPVSTMGASKRLAEMVVLEIQEEHPRTAYTAVRFGNVLGSNGSVIPIFKQQLAAGRPLTVTDPEATRYFMTIPEAVQLILQASLLRELRGHIAMLEMGEPVRILDLAFNLLRMAGMPTQGGVVFSGLRPGERLHEELTAPDETTRATLIPKVRLVETSLDSGFRVSDRLQHWERAFDAAQGAGILEEVRALFPGLRRGSTRAASVQVLALAPAEVVEAR
jgi:FlaA1/EpsC-like NDP-sugar epimerase